MSKHKRKATQVTVNEPVSKQANPGLWRRRPALFFATLLVPLILIIGGVVYYRVQAAPFQQPVVTVDKSTISMDYFLKRTKMSGNSPTSMLQQLVNEQLVKEAAPTFGISVTPQEINDYLLTTASTANTSGNMADNVTGRYLTEGEFNTWYQQRLKDTGLSDTEYKEMTRTLILGNKLRQFLATNIATTISQVHLNVIVVANSADAAKAKLRIQQGDNFTAVARDVSLDTQSKDQGGDIGWIPPGVLGFNGVPIYDSTIFTLPVGVVSDAVTVNPSAPTTSRYLLFMVSEKASNRVIDDSAMQVLKQNALSNWLFQEAPSHNIVLNYDFNNEANQAWIDWQLTKVSR